MPYSLPCVCAAKFFMYKSRQAVSSKPLFLRRRTDAQPSSGLYCSPAVQCGRILGRFRTYFAFRLTSAVLPDGIATALRILAGFTASETARALPH
ncbi:AaceriABL060Cp [[Ashbya] aceris (nom. inval.)]|nr:AaceriABL060Cp [[Ashbya] aceris (nom. inval.)]